MARRLKLGILISGRGSNLQALIDACADPGFPAEIALVVSNKADAKGLERAATASIPTRVIDHRGFASRTEFDSALNDALNDAAVDLVCLAGFMRLLGAEFVRAWHDRLINIHPSLLPAFRGLHTHERALEAGVKLTGCTVHFVRADVDNGPIIVQAAVPVLDTDTPDSLAARVLVAEHACYPAAVRWIAEDRVSIVDDRVVLRDGSTPEAPVFSPCVTTTRRYTP